MKNLWVLLILTVGFLSLMNSQLINGDNNNNDDDDDLVTLVAIGKEVKLVDWNEDKLKNTSSYCSWPHITCNSNQFVEKVVITHQNLEGNITLISRLKSLKWLDLSFNTLHGPIPKSLGNLFDLEFLDLSYNKFDGSIPIELGLLKNLKFLNISNNLLIGSIPNELKGLVKLQDLQVYTNNLDGKIPTWVGNLSNLRVFNAYENELRGKIPENLGAFSELEVLNLHSNYLEGSIPESLFANGKLEVLILTQNRLNGSLPDSVGKCKGFSSLRIGDNELTGNIPKEIGNLGNLEYFEVDNNNLSGEIVQEFGQCSNLKLLNLASNGFSGIIPPVFSEMNNLEEFIVSGNDLFGEIPSSVFSNKNLNKIDLSNNRFNGSIPKSVCNSSRLQYLLLGQNSLTGPVPNEIGNCLKLLELQLGGNYLTGQIPPEIGKIKNLEIALNLSFNHLNGQLPPDLGKLDKLVCLDLSNNQLTGDIPLALKGMLSLLDVNFANNCLTGPIPAFGPFQRSPNSSFSNNKGLCGYPLSFLCGNPNGPQSFHHSVSYKTVLVVIGSGLLVFASVTIVVVLFMIREKLEKLAKMAQKEDEEVNDDGQPLVILGNMFVENLKQAVDFDAVVKATLKDSNKVSSGTFSTIYKAEMPSGLTLSVKRLKSVDKTIIHQQNKMIRELERLSHLCHDNLIRPIGFAIYDDVALLLHQFLPNGSLARFLHESSKEQGYKPDWPVRLSIAVGVAEGLTFLHSLAIIHLDISSGNIFLDSGFKPLIGEVEISKLLDPSRGTASISAVAGSFGYIPPEYAYTMQVTAPGNVYSFGVVLLEILTTRAPVDEAFGEGVDLVKWVQGAATRGETPEQILDAKLSTVSFQWRKEMLSALKVALMCTDSTPAKRPKMKKVVEMLQEIIENK
ncbi:leucine-rich repeat receptor-like tyrosine-protein kinase PXC3 [Bidens hawaiensis]|uniref:leucine-rich repeat receptor-like tyrosine-protein kinase PXC3 n=1 Tax=Bidens hawaiensis TaxID=980011 RepID=UPI00404AF30E